MNSTLQQYRKKLDRSLSEYNHAARQTREEKEALKEAKEKVENTARAQEIVQTIAEKVQNLAHQQISKVVTRCLETVFEDESPEFRIIFERKRSKTDAVLAFVRDGIVMDNPTYENGGGLIDTAAFALRLGCLKLSRPQRRGLIISDEPFKNIHGEQYQSNMAELLMVLAKEMRMQFVIVTGEDWLRIGKVVEIE